MQNGLKYGISMEYVTAIKTGQDPGKLVKQQKSSQQVSDTFSDKKALAG